MASLTLDEVRDIGIAGARRVIGDTASDVAVTLGVDHDGKEAYFFVFRFPTEAGWDRATRLAARMMVTIIDELQARNDERFPFVRLLSDGSWNVTRHAATG